MEPIALMGLIGLGVFGTGGFVVLMIGFMVMGDRFGSGMLYMVGGFSVLVLSTLGLQALL